MKRQALDRGRGCGLDFSSAQIRLQKAKTDNTVSNEILTCVRKVCYFRSFVFIGRYMENNLF